MSQNNNLLKIGKITKFHGLCGFVVFEKLAWIKKLVLPIGNEIFIKELNKKLKIEKYFIKQEKQVIKFFEFDSLDEVKKLKNFYIYVNKNDFLKLTNNFPYLPFLINFECEFNNQIIGRMINFFSTISNPVIEVSNGEQKFLIPFVSQYIKNINYKNSKIILDNKFNELINLF